MLSTVGYGDFYPISTNEMVFAIFSMLGGVAFFSYIMGVLIDIMANWKEKMGAIDKSDDLKFWLLEM